MKLKLRLRSEFGALQRVLVHAARRGFEPVVLMARPDGDELAVEMEMRGPRDIGLLARTLERLYEVVEVSPA